MFFGRNVAKLPVAELASAERTANPVVVAGVEEAGASQRRCVDDVAVRPVAKGRPAERVEPQMLP